MTDKVYKQDRLREARRKKLPYGRWLRASDGAQLLFNRDYEAIWERHDDGTTAELTPAAIAVRQIEHPIFFYNDADSETKRVEAGLAALEEWGLPIPDEFLQPWRRAVKRRK